MIHELFKISDTDGTDFRKLELRSDSVRTFDTKKDDTIIAMQKQQDKELPENLYFRHLEKI